MTVQEVMKELEAMATPSTKKTLINHGAREPFFGVKIGDMKVLQKRIKKDYELSLGLYDTGNSDALWLFKVKSSEIIYPNEVIDDYLLEVRRSSTPTLAYFVRSTWTIYSPSG